MIILVVCGKYGIKNKKDQLKINKLSPQHHSHYV